MCGNVRSQVRGCHHWGILSVSLPAVNVDESTTSAYMERLVEGFVRKERGKAYSLGVWGDGGKGDTQCGQLVRAVPALLVWYRTAVGCCANNKSLGNADG